VLNCTIYIRLYAARNVAIVFHAKRIPDLSYICLSLAALHSLERLAGLHTLEDHIMVMLPPVHRIGGLVVKLAVAIRDHISIIRPAPGSIPGRCMTALTSVISFVLLLSTAFHDLFCSHEDSWQNQHVS
jgi:hypothetical protein